MACGGDWLLGLTMGAALMASGCGNANESPDADPAQQDSGGESDAVSMRPEVEALAIDVEGYPANENGASAQVLIREDDGVRLTISGGLEEKGYVLFTLELVDPSTIVGEHDWVIELPMPESLGTASANLGGAEYYSQGGQVHLWLDDAGHIEGEFSVDLAEVPTEATREPYRVRAEYETVSGSFAGGFTVSCYSRIPAHSTWLEGGTFCMELGL